MNQESNMYKKLIASVLVVALLNLVGCYSFAPVTVPEYQQVEEKEGKPDEIRVITKDSQEYHFTDFYIKNDTLYGKGISLLSFGELPYEGKFALGEIESIQLEDFVQEYPSLMTVSQYQNIEAESGKPDEIYLTKDDATRYHFMNNDYYIENDTLYGKGKLLSDDSEQQLDRKIALSNIESIEVESLDWGNTLLFAGGITVGILAVAYLILLAICSKPGSCGP